jgi:hypothetical protein
LFLLAPYLFCCEPSANASWLHVMYKEAVCIRFWWCSCCLFFFFAALTASSVVFSFFGVNVSASSAIVVEGVSNGACR